MYIDSLGYVRVIAKDHPRAKPPKYAVYATRKLTIVE